MKWYSITDNNIDVYGMDRRFERLPEGVAKSVSEAVAGAYNITAGGRIRFATNTKNIAIRADVLEHRDVGFDLYRVDGNREFFSVGFRNIEYFICKGQFEAVNRLSDGTEVLNYTLNFPYAAKFASFYLGIDDDAVLQPGARYINEKPVVFYGSSITHGAWASRPGVTYEAMISQKYNLNYLNLGFSGAARGEKEIAEYMSGLNMCAFVCDYDHNANDCNELKNTHLNLYTTIRAAHPDIPYIIITKPDYFSNPTENRKRQNIITKTYEYALDNGDKKVYFIDGKTLFDGEFYHNCTKDGLHPNDIGFYRMQEVIGSVLAEALSLNKSLKHDTLSENITFVGDPNPSSSWWKQFYEKQ